jgi:FAD synthase
VARSCLSDACQLRQLARAAAGVQAVVVGKDFAFGVGGFDGPHQEKQKARSVLTGRALLNN